MSTAHCEEMDQSQKIGDLESATNGNGYGETLNRLKSAQSISMSPEMFEKLYLSPPNRVSGNLRTTFGNPTPLALVGFLLSLMPLSCDLMGWRGAGDFGIATIAVYFFMGGLLMSLSGVFEWILGNSFPSTVFCSFGGFWLAFGGTLNPSFGAYSFYATDASVPKTGMADPKFNSSLGFWLLFMGVLALIPAFGLLTKAFWLLAEDFAGNASKANTLFVGAGACLFVTCFAGWYILVAILFALVDFPFQIPVGDLTNVIKSGSARK